MTVHRPRYGRYLEEFTAGNHWWHPRAITIPRALAYQFAATFMEANPIYLAEPNARRAGYRTVPLHPLLVLNVALALGVENNSEQAIAHLGYYDVQFLQPVYPGTTIRSASRVLEVRDRGEGRPGVVRVATVAVDDEGAPLLSYERAILIPRRPADAADRWQAPASNSEFPLADTVPQLPNPGDGPAAPDLEVGDVVLHPNGRTITDEHMFWSYWLGNTHPLHYDRRYSAARSGPLSGEPVVYGGLVFAWVAGLASRDVTAAAVWEMGYDRGFHTAPVHSGDTLTAASRLEARGTTGSGVTLTLTLVGLKNCAASEAWSHHGEALFGLDRDKPPEERVEEKCFEITRTLLYRAGEAG